MREVFLIDATSTISEMIKVAVQSARIRKPRGIVWLGQGKGQQKDNCGTLVGRSPKPAREEAELRLASHIAVIAPGSQGLQLTCCGGLCSNSGTIATPRCYIFGVLAVIRHEGQLRARRDG